MTTPCFSQKAERFARCQDVFEVGDALMQLLDGIDWITRVEAARIFKDVLVLFL